MTLQQLLRSVISSLLCAKWSYAALLTLDHEYPFKYYCYFDTLLQSVCLAKHQHRGVNFFSHNTASQNPRASSDVIYRTQTCPYSSQRVADPSGLPVWRTGAWKNINTQCFPWEIGPKTRYRKVNGKNDRPGHFDIQFTPNEAAKRFSHLIPVSIQEVPLPPDGRVIFEMNKPVKWTAILSQGPSSANTGRHDRILTIERKSGPLTFEFERRRKFPGSLVEEFGASGLTGGAEVFFFELPTDTLQHAIMLTTLYGSYMLYRTDQIEARQHHLLPPPDNDDLLPEWTSLMICSRYPGDPPPYEAAIMGDFNGSTCVPHVLPTYDEAVGTAEASGGPSQ